MTRSRGIKSIETAGKLLEVLSSMREPSELNVLAESAGISTSLAHAYVTSFGRMGLVTQNPVNKRYGLGDFAVELGLSELHRLDPIDLALDKLTTLQKELELTVALSVWGSHGPTVIRVRHGAAPFHATLYEGATLPLRSTATGLAFAAFFTDSMIQTALQNEPEHHAGGATDDFTVLVQEARRRSIARVIGRPVPGLASFSAPVFNHASTMICAISVSGQAETIDTAWDGHVARALGDAAQSLSRRLGMRCTAQQHDT